MSPQELKNLLKLLRSQGVLKYETDGLKLELCESLPRKEPRAERVEIEPDRELTYEEQLFYSSEPPLETEGDN
jgi:hypothetical protein